MAFMPNGEYAPSSLIHGIRWYQGLSLEIQCRLSNIDMLIQPNVPLSKISQVSTLTGVFFIGDPGSSEMDHGDIVIGGRSD
jgi:hypothetical protein